MKEDEHDELQIQHEEAKDQNASLKGELTRFK